MPHMQGRTDNATKSFTPQWSVSRNRGQASIHYNYGPITLTWGFVFEFSRDNGVVAQKTPQRCRVPVWTQDAEALFSINRVLGPSSIGNLMYNYIYIYIYLFLRQKFKTKNKEKIIFELTDTLLKRLCLFSLCPNLTGTMT